MTSEDIDEKKKKKLAHKLSKYATQNSEEIKYVLERITNIPNRTCRRRTKHYIRFYRAAADDISSSGLRNDTKACTQLPPTRTLPNGCF